MRRSILIFLIVCGLAACRGQQSENPPLHGIRNMMIQWRFDPQSRNPLFPDERAQRVPVPGTVERDRLMLDPAFWQGRNPDGTFVHAGPVPVTMDLLRRGRERFNIYCGVCHDRTGSGQGLPVTQYQGMAPPPTYHQDRIRYMADGQIFDTITHGVRTMPAYRYQIPEADRWAIIAYVRALQRSQHATLADVPADRAGTLD
ncbi:MAG: cytochrome c [bacterium]|nr:cytochrome c [bacterium]